MRQKMVEEFENIVKQEIINHNREIEQSNQKIRSFSDQLFKQKESFSTSISILTTEFKKISELLNTYMTQTNSMLCKICSSIQNLEFTVAECKGLSADRRKEIIALEDLCSKLQISFYNNIKNVGEEIEKSKEIYRNSLSSIDSVKRELLEEIDKLKDVEYPKNNYDEEVKIISNCLKMQNDSIENLSKAIEKIQKNSFYLEKKVEHLYNKLKV